jgi:uncharacterized protein (TIGR02453 family)
MFTPAALTFLRQLKRNNRRDWFQPRKDAFETILLAPMREFVEEMDVRLATIAPEIGGSPKRSIFRIYRDVRFSKDKSPYNAHLHIAWFPSPPSAAKGEFSGYYFGLEPDRLQLGAGVFEVGGAALDRFRAAIDEAERGSRLEATLDDLAAAGFRFEGPTLKRTPAPYASDHPRAAWLRHKGLSAWREITDRKRIETPALLTECVETFAQLAPLHAWLMDALTTA